MKAVLSIAGSDSSGGAGIQADIKTIAAHHLFAETVITALTAQNTMGVTGVSAVDPAFVEQQIDAVFEDIRPAAVKIGMVSSPEIVRAIASGLKRHQAENIVLDPVMVATSGSALIVDDAIQALVDELFPLASVITPNIPEAESLTGLKISSEETAEQAALVLSELTSGSVLVKGGHGAAYTADDLLCTSEGEMHWLRGQRIDNPNTHGTGCTLSSAIACDLAKGLDVVQSVRAAKDYVAKCLEAQLDLGQGSGPMDHLWMLE